MLKLPFKSESVLHWTALFLRLTSALMLRHGWSKLMHFSEKSSSFADPLHVGNSLSMALTIFAEFFCTIFIITGFFTRVAVIPLIICFFIIVFIVEASESFGDKELAVIYLLVYISIFISGSGKFSLDYLIRKKY